MLRRSCFLVCKVVGYRKGGYMQKNSKTKPEQTNKAKEVSLLESVGTDIPGGYHRCGVGEGYPLAFVSESFLSTVGYTKEQLIEEKQNHYLELVAPEDIEFFLSHAPELEARGRVDLNYRIVRRDGSYRWVQDSTKRTIIDGEEYYQCTLTDITEFVEKQEKIVAENLEYHKKEIYFSTVVDNIPGGFHRCKVEEGCPFLYVGDSFTKIMGWTGEEIEERFDNKFQNMIVMEDRDKLNELTEGLSGTEIGTSIYRMYHKDGGYRWVQDSTILVETEGDRFYQGAISDVTDFVENLRRLTSSSDEILAIASKDQILSEITQMLYSYNLTVNLRTGKYVLIVGNGLEEFVEFYRTTNDYKTAYEFKLGYITPEFKDAYIELTSLEKMRKRKKQNGLIGSMQYSVNVNDAIQWHEVNIFMGTNEYGDRIVNLLCRDITESRNSQEKREHELRAVNSKDQILSEITKMLYSYNLTLNLKNGKYGLNVGTGMENFINIFQSTDDYEEALEKKLVYVDPNFIKEFRTLADLSNLRKISHKKGFVKSLEYSCIVDGKQEWHEINVFMGTNEQGEDIANLLGRDITEAHEKADTKNQLEIAQASNEAKTRFLSNMSHDIRTPINGIMGMLHIAKTHKDDAVRVEDCLGKIETSANYLLTLLNDILDLNKLESGKTVAEENPFSMYELIDDICTITQPSTHISSITLKKECGTFKYPNVIGSTLHLRQILMNLTSNSIKYSNENGTVYVRVEELDREEDIVQYKFSVIDNGIGMTKEFQQKMFDMFEQEQSGARTTHKGSGLGLAIVKLLVDLLGGKLTVESEKDKGSTFTVILPFKIDANPITKDEKTVVNTTECLEGIRILVVEDNEFNMEIAQVILEEAGAVITTAENGKVAVELFENSPEKTFDIILMDVMMPEMDGLEATRVIRAMNRTDATEIPIIAMTANAFSEDIKKSLEAGMNEHIAKPLDMSSLANAIAKLLK